jgi:hypothetical protein
MLNGCSKKQKLIDLLTTVETEANIILEELPDDCEKSDVVAIENKIAKSEELMNLVKEKMDVYDSTSEEYYMLNDLYMTLEYMHSSMDVMVQLLSEPLILIAKPNLAVQLETYTSKMEESLQSYITRKTNLGLGTDIIDAESEYVLEG